MRVYGARIGIEEELTKVLDSDERKRLAELAVSGDGQENKQARMRLVLSMTKFIVSIAARKYRLRGVDLEEAVRECHMRLWAHFSPAKEDAASPNPTAITSRFKPSLGYDPITYASHIINSALLRLMMKQNPISFSWKFNQQIGTLKKELERYGPIDSKTFAKLLEKVGISQFLIAQYFRMKNLASLDAPLQGHFATHSANTALVENVPDPATLDFAQKVTTEVQVTKILQEIFQEVQLSEREIEILTLRYGLNGQTAHNYKQIGKIFGITGERIRQIITAAERKIKTWLQEEHPEYIRIIQKSFFN